MRKFELYILMQNYSNLMRMEGNWCKFFTCIIIGVLCWAADGSLQTMLRLLTVEPSVDAEMMFTTAL